MSNPRQEFIEAMRETVELAAKMLSTGRFLRIAVKLRRACIAFARAYYGTADMGTADLFRDCGLEEESDGD